MILDLITKTDLDDFKKELFELLKQTGVNQKNAVENKKWLRSAEVRHLLNISPGTLQNLRINGTLPFKKIGSILYYAYSDIVAVMNKGAM
ncbi:helix-turn-helix domain-containing protein [Pedobacter paludis]|uniref:DNA-binding protein n=1 Tax=Pedobacter paludis TaxID=2203212 RepID=A0A317F6Z0_9SPHI|nr:helix-turn-helix domain-containing protein [Pedobacter paludis]PWS33288.1 DNA-binding protein [Pedobacter paludis]